MKRCFLIRFLLKDCYQLLHPSHHSLFPHQYLILQLTWLSTRSSVLCDCTCILRGWFQLQWTELSKR
ncbi:hypothetical protein FF1_040478 [Malus domestica]